MTKKQKAKLNRIKKQQFPAHALAFLLIVAMFIEGMAFGVANAKALEDGVKVLDVSRGVIETKLGLEMIAEPFVYTVRGVHNFYKMAGEVTAELLEDNLVDNIASLIQSVNSFYRMASNELASALDISGLVSPPGKTAYAY